MARDSCHPTTAKASDFTKATFAWVSNNRSGSHSEPAFDWKSHANLCSSNYPLRRNFWCEQALN